MPARSSTRVSSTRSWLDRRRHAQRGGPLHREVAARQRLRKRRLVALLTTLAIGDGQCGSGSSRGARGDQVPLRAGTPTSFAASEPLKPQDFRFEPLGDIAPASATAVDSTAAQPGAGPSARTTRDRRLTTGSAVPTSLTSETATPLRSYDRSRAGPRRASDRRAAQGSGRGRALGRDVPVPRRPEGRRATAREGGRIRPPWGSRAGAATVKSVSRRRAASASAPRPAEGSPVAAAPFRGRSRPPTPARAARGARPSPCRSARSPRT